MTKPAKAKDQEEEETKTKTKTESAGEAEGSRSNHQRLQAIELYQALIRASVKDKDAMKMLMNVPPPLRKMVIGNTEEAAEEQGQEKVTAKLFTDLAREVGMDTELMDRFRSGG